MKLITTLFPEYNWLPWKFNSVPNGYWNDKENQLKFMEWLFHELNFKLMTDWYNINAKVNTNYLMNK